MLFFILLLCIHLQYALSSNTSNPASLDEAIKFLESLNLNKHEGNAPETVIATPPVYPPDLLSVIHNLKPDQLIGQADHTDTDQSFLLQSREIDKIDVSHVNDQRKFLDWVKKLFIKERRPFRKPNSTTTTRRPVTKSQTPTKKKPRKYKKNRADDEEESTLDTRRLMNWFRDLFGGATTELPTTTPIELVEKAVLTTHEDDFNLTTVLNKLNNALESLNENLHVQNLNANATNGFFVLKMPVIANNGKELNRRKRDANINTTASEEDAQFTNDTVVNTNNTIGSSSTRRSNNNAAFLVHMRPNYVKIHENIYEHNKIQSSSQEFKNKLIDHLISAFKEIKQKLSPLNEVKERYSGDDMYRIGYILANIDVLEINLDKLIAELEVRKLAYDENKLLELFDKLKTSSDVISNLIVSLKKYIKNQQ